MDGETKCEEASHMLGPDAAKLPFQHKKKENFLLKEWRDTNFSGFSPLSRT